jgi:hypothetical protein
MYVMDMGFSTRCFLLRLLLVSGRARAAGLGVVSCIVEYNRGAVSATIGRGNARGHQRGAGGRNEEFGGPQVRGGVRYLREGWFRREEWREGRRQQGRRPIEASVRSAVLPR